MADEFFAERVGFAAMVERFVFVGEELFEFLEVFFPVPTIDGYSAIGFHGVDEERGAAVALGLAEELRPDSVCRVLLAIRFSRIRVEPGIPKGS